MQYKVFWAYILDECDKAGVWKEDIGLASFYVGTPLSVEEILEIFNEGKERLVVLPSGKWHLPHFIEYQYGCLSATCAPHKTVLKLIKRHGLNLSSYPNKLPYLGKVTVRVQEEEEEAFNTNRTNKVIRKANKVNNNIIKKDLISNKEVLSYIVNKWNSTELKKVATISKARTAKIIARLKNQHFKDNWEAALGKMANSGFCLGNNRTGQPFGIDWFIANDDNYVKALEGNYDDKSLF